MVHGVLHFPQMSITLTIRLPEDLLEQLREKSRRTGLPVGRVVRQFVENGLSQDIPQARIRLGANTWASSRVVLAIFLPANGFHANEGHRR